MAPPLKRAPALLACALAGGAVAGCAKTVSTSSFSGEAHGVAQAVSDLQSDVTAGDERKVCANDLAASLVSRLNALQRRTKSGRSERPGCRRVVNDQLAQVDNYDMSVVSVQVRAGSPPTASARVRSIFAGKSRFSTLSLVKEGGRWKVSGSG
jgi:outer membrane murein-binding lipoprotein Lpp